MNSQKVGFLTKVALNGVYPIFFLFIAVTRQKDEKEKWGQQGASYFEKTNSNAKLGHSGSMAIPLLVKIKDSSSKFSTLTM